MAIFNPKVNTASIPRNDETVPERPKPKKYDGVEVETKYEDQRKLLTYISGRSWFVDYYSQVLGFHDETSAHSVGTPGAFQQYRRIKRFELKVTSALSPEYDQEAVEWKSNGTAMIYPSIKPNLGDVFVADIGDGKLGIFSVDGVKENSYFKDTTYEIEYSLQREFKDQYKEDLLKKVVQTNVLDKDQLIHGNTGVVNEEVYLSNQELLHWKEILFKRLYQDFIDPDEHTWRVPTSSLRMYDHMYALMMRKLFDIDQHPQMAHVRILNVDTAKKYDYVSLWDALLDRDRQLLYLCDKDFNIAERYVFYAPVVLGSAFWSSFDGFIFPKMFSQASYNPALGKFDSSHHIKPIAFYEHFDHRCLNDNTKPYIWPVLKDNAYVLSNAFYKTGNRSVVEEMLSSYLDGNGVDRQKLEEILKVCMNWKDLERFYYHPILCILIMGAVYAD